MGKKSNNKRHGGGYRGITPVKDPLHPPAPRWQDLPDLEDVRQYASEFGWEERPPTANPSVVIFDRSTKTNGHEQINYYWTTFTVQSHVYGHPNKQKRDIQMHRRMVSKKMLRAIFENPRVHTDRGYQHRER